MTSHTVGMVSSYKAISQCDWLWKQTPQSFGHWGNIQLIAKDPNPNYLLLYNFDFHKYYRSQQTGVKSLLKATLRGEFSKWQQQNDNSPEERIHAQLRNVPKEKIFFLVREPPLPEVVQKQKKSYHYASDYCSYSSGPSDFAPIPDYMPAIWYVNISFDELNKGAVPVKSRLCSWITSGINRSKNHQKRLSFLRSIHDSDITIDVYGRDLPEWSVNFGALGNKWSGMAPYYYNLAIENYAENDLYVSEKLWDALLSWCLPIYYGGGAADKLLPPGSFLRLPSLDEKGIAYIRDIISSPDAWHEAKEAIAEARQIILHELNLLNWLEKRITA